MTWLKFIIVYIEHFSNTKFNAQIIFNNEQTEKVDNFWFSNSLGMTWLKFIIVYIEHFSPTFKSKV